MTARAAASLNAPRVHSRSRLVFDAPGGRTRMSVSDLGAPLRVMRGFELDDGRLLVQVISAAPGLFAGDLYELDVEAGRGARAVILTPAATKIHSMPSGGSAVQSITARVAEGASLEIYPTLSIPFAQCEFRQSVDVAMAGDGRFGWLDPWAFGRIAKGEKYAFRRLTNKLRVDRDGRPLYRDAMDLEPSQGDVARTGILEHATHAITGCWFGPCNRWTPQGALDADQIYGCIGEDGLYIRGLFDEGAAFHRGLEKAHAAVVQAWDLTPISQQQFTL